MVEVEVAGDGVGPTVDFGACGIPDCKNWAWKNLCAELRATPIQTVPNTGGFRVRADTGCNIRNRNLPDYTLHNQVVEKPSIVARIPSADTSKYLMSGLDDLIV